MKKNPYLDAASKIFKKQKMHSQFRDENILEVSQDKGSKVFAILILEEKQFPGILVSLSYDYSEIYVVAEMVINLMHLSPCALGEAFYRSKNGNLYWGVDAAFHYTLECDQQVIEDIVPVSKDLH
jgi:hypothetical protein